MKCMNGSCGVPLQQSEAQLVLKVVLCRMCAKAVQTLKNQTRSELEVAIATLDDLLRFALTTDLHLQTPDSDVTPLEFIAEVQRQCRSTTRTTSSSKSTKPSVDIADGSESSLKP